MPFKGLYAFEKPLKALKGLQNAFKGLFQAFKVETQLKQTFKHRLKRPVTLYLRALKCIIGIDFVIFSHAFKKLVGGGKVVNKMRISKSKYYNCPGPKGARLIPRSPD